MPSNPTPRPTTTAPAPESLGIFGGSFDPPHTGHVLACLLALSAHPIDRVLVVPTFIHPFGKPLAPFHHRVEMLRLALRHLQPWVEVSLAEQQLGGVSYTIETLQWLRAQLPPTTTMRLIVGADIPQQFDKWHKADEVRDLAPPLVIGRAGVAEPGRPGTPRHFLPEVSSTEVRAAIAARVPLGEQVPLAVASYIATHGLYADPQRP